MGTVTVACRCLWQRGGIVPDFAPRCESLVELGLALEVEGALSGSELSNKDMKDEGGPPGEMDRLPYVLPVCEGMLGWH